jgi:chromosomal replication initiation ATPase DnaA
MKYPQLPLVDKVDYSFEAWLESDCNRMATEWLKNWQNAPCRFTCVCGPRGAGKTHLAMAFAELSGAWIASPQSQQPQGVNLVLNKVPPQQIGENLEGGRGDVDGEKVWREDSERTWRGACVFDDLEFFDEVWLFNAYNRIQSLGGYALFTTSCQPCNWNFKLKDLESRLKGCTIINIAAPDDNLLRNLILKITRDYSLYIDTQIVDFLLSVLPRTFYDVLFCLQELNRISVISNTKISKKMIIDWLEERAGNS